jgi:hypothetical protein
LATKNGNYMLDPLRAAAGDPKNDAKPGAKKHPQKRVFAPKKARFFHFFPRTPARRT